VQDGVLYKGMKVIISTSTRLQMTARVHSSHLKPDTCVHQARDGRQIKEQVQYYEGCNDFLARQQKEPLMTHKIPDTSWSNIGHDPLMLGNENHLVIVDHSDYF